jgi:hypothetical protein
VEELIHVNGEDKARLAYERTKLVGLLAERERALRVAEQALDRERQIANNMLVGNGHDPAPTPIANSQVSTAKFGHSQCEIDISIAITAKCSIATAARARRLSRPTHCLGSADPRPGGNPSD